MIFPHYNRVNRLAVSVYFLDSRFPPIDINCFGEWFPSKSHDAEVQEDSSTYDFQRLVAFKAPVD